MDADESMIIAEPWSSWTDGPLSDSNHNMHNKLSSRSKKSVEDLLESAKRRQQAAEAAMAAKAAKQQEHSHREREHEAAVRAKRDQHLTDIGETTQRKQAAAEALRQAKLQQQAERLKRDAERAELVRQRKMNLPAEGVTDRNSAGTSSPAEDIVIDLPWSMFGTKEDMPASPTKDLLAPPKDNPLHSKLSSRSRKSVEEIMEESKKKEAAAEAARALRDEQRALNSQRERERADKVRERRTGAIDAIGEKTQRQQAAAEALRTAKLQQQQERLQREKERAEQVRRRRLESPEKAPPDDLTETPAGSPMQKASEASEPMAMDALQEELSARTHAKATRAELPAPVPFKAEMEVDSEGKPLVMEITARAWVDKPSAPPQIHDKLSARRQKTPEEVLQEHKRRQQAAEGLRAAQAAAQSHRLQKEREKEDMVRIRIETNAQAKIDQAASKADEKMRSAEGIAARKASRRQLAADRKHQREKAAKARQMNATRTFGTTTLDDDDKLRLLKIVKENKLSALQEMASSGELGRLRNFQNHYGDSALILAAWYGHLDVARLLLDVNADVDIANCDGNTALNCAAYRGHADMVEHLLIEGSEVDVQDNVTGKTALIKAAYGGHHKVVRLLLEAEADPDAMDSQGYGALAFAASFGHREVLAALLEHEDDPDVADQFGITPLIHAAARGDFLSVRLLLEAGATATKEDVEGKSAIDYADSAGFDDVVAILADYASRDPNTAGMLQSSAGAMTERLQQVAEGNGTARNGTTAREYTDRTYRDNITARMPSVAPISQRGGHTARLTPRMPPPQQSSRPRVPLGGVGDAANALGTPRGFRGMKANGVEKPTGKVTPADMLKVDAGSMAYLTKKLFNLSILLEQDTVSEDIQYPTFAC